MPTSDRSFTSCVPLCLAVCACLAVFAWVWPVQAAPPKTADDPVGTSDDDGGDVGDAIEIDEGDEPLDAAPSDDDDRAAEPAAGGQDPAPPPPPTPPTIDLALRAAQIGRLIDGTLDPSVDAEALFVVPLADPSLGPNGEHLTGLLTALAQPSPPKRRRSKSPTAALSPPVAAFVAAYRSFLELPLAERRALLEAHANKHQAALAGVDPAAIATRAADDVEERAEHLEAYLAGTLAPEVDPSALLSVDLAQPSEVSLSPARRGTWLTMGTASPASPPSTPGALLVAAQARLDAARRKYLALAPTERLRLAQMHDAAAAQAAEARRLAEAAAAEPPEPEPEAAPPETAHEVLTAQVISEAEAEADQAAKDRAAALEKMRTATTKAKRMLAAEEARLLEIKEKQAHYEADLNRRTTERDENHETALAWKERVTALTSSTKFASEKAAEADPMYQEIREQLAELRDRLRAELNRIKRAGEDIPVVGDGLDADLPADVDRGPVTQLRAELTAHERELERLEASVGWDLAQGLRDDVVMLNRTRLLLLEMASSSLRSDVTGFGAPGVEQVSREFAQISVELSFHAMKIRRYGDTIWDKLRESTIVVLLGAIQLVLVIAAYYWWRKVGGTVLSTLEHRLREIRPSTRLHSASITFLWYLQRVRRPLEALLVLYFLFSMVSAESEFPELNLLWIIAGWVLAGLAAILFVDALAARETIYSDVRGNATLRIHSLRVVGLNVIAVGLILSLTSAMVGKGAIYSWVFSTCWLLSLPVILYLVHKWRATIYERIERRPAHNGFTRWVLSKKTGPASFAAATGGAGFLMFEGFWAWLMRQLSGLETTRRLLAYLFRRELAKQAEATKADTRYSPISKEVYDAFNPERVPTALLDDVAGTQLDQVAKLAGTAHATLSSVVGERGSGKSQFLSRLRARVGQDKVRVLTCPEEGIDALMAQLAGLTDDPKLRGPELAAALRKLGAIVIAVDDLQRLVVPAVNGLADLDRFTDFTRQVGAEISWVVTIGSASWHYMQRARGDRVFFEQVVRLPHWSEEQLGTLLRDACAKANIDPSFQGLVVPRQADAPAHGQAEKSEAERSQAGYYRLLWDFSRGNPAVALHAFRESLFVSDEDEMVVRLFKEPSPEEIEDLPRTLLFVLRTAVQLELASPEEVTAATQIPRADVDDAIRFCVARGYLEPYLAGFRLTWPWYRTITTVLQRQHLLPAL